MLKHRLIGSILFAAIAVTPALALSAGISAGGTGTGTTVGTSSATTPDGNMGSVNTGVNANTGTGTTVGTGAAVGAKAGSTGVRADTSLNTDATVNRDDSTDGRYAHRPHPNSGDIYTRSSTTGSVDDTTHVNTNPTLSTTANH
jgi:hypothetical protein